LRLQLLRTVHVRLLATTTASNMHADHEHPDECLTLNLHGRFPMFISNVYKQGPGIQILVLFYYSASSIPFNFTQF